MNNEEQEQSGAEESAVLGWCILELMGHRRLGGNVSEVTIAGVAMLRIDVPLVGGVCEAKEFSSPFATQYYSGASIYCITPTTEQVARAVAYRAQPEPVQRWELATLPAVIVDPAPSDGADDGADDGVPW